MAVIVASLVVVYSYAEPSHIIDVDLGKWVPCWLRGSEINKTIKWLFPLEEH